MTQVTVEQAMELAGQHYHAGQFDHAESIYRQILAVAPDAPFALNMLGLLAGRKGDAAAAVQFIARAVQLMPRNAPFHNNLAEFQRQTGRLDDAANSFRRAIQLQPDYADAFSNLANVMLDQCKWDDAITACRSALAINSAHKGAFNNLACAFERSGRIDNAIDARRHALAVAPDSPTAQTNLGLTLAAAGYNDEALQHIQRAIDSGQQHAPAYNALGTVLGRIGESDQAVAAFRTALRLNPNNVEWLSNLGIALRDKGLLDEALSCFDRARALSPRDPSLHSNRVFAIHFHPAFDAPAILREQRLWDQTHGMPRLGQARPHHNDPAPDRVLRIGYVSPDFRQHVIGRNILPLLREHNRGEFEIYCYAQVERPDEFTEIFRSLPGAWRNTVGMSDEALASQIVHDRIDILIDLALHTGNNRLPVFAYKPAPVQVTFAGYPAGTGLSAIDYRLTDPYLDPPGETDDQYVEKSIRLPDSFWCYEMSSMMKGIEPIPQVSPLPALKNGYVTFGSLNHFSKVNDQVLHRWASVLKSVPGSRLLMLAPSPTDQTRVLTAMLRGGVDSSRIAFVGYVLPHQHFQRYHQIDIILDTLPYNGHTTSLDAFWMGVPVVTLTGRTCVGRAGFSQLMNLGLAHLCAHDEAQFVAIATSLAGDISGLASLRASLRQRMESCPLMDVPKFVTNIESAYRQMWRRWCESRIERAI